MAYIGTSPSNGVRRIHTYTATAGQTTFTGSSTEGVTLTYADTNYIDVFQNGVLLGSADYTSTSGTSVVLAQGASVSDLVVIVVYDVFSVADTVSKTAGGTFDGDLTVSGAFTSQGIDDNADATAITIDSSENVGIGTSSPSSLLHINNTADSANGITIQNASSSGSADAYLQFTTANSTVRMGIDATGTDIFKISNGTALGTNDALAIDSSGNVLVGTTTGRGKITILHSSNSTATPTLWCGNDGASAVWVSFGNSSGGVYGSISRSGSSTAYNTTSDHRLKENVDYTFDATTRLKQLKPCRFNFIADADTTVDGFLAHEVQSVVPEAITGTHNEEDDEGNPIMQGIDQSKIVPLLVKTIQELEARITALENGE